MLRKFLILSCLFLLFLSGATSLAKTKDRPLSPFVVDIEIQGNREVPAKQIFENVFTRIGDSLVQEKLQGDVKAIYAMGFFSDVAVSLEAAGQGNKVVFRVKENPRIRDIIIDGNTVYGTAEILALLSSRTGELLNFNALRDDIQKINTLYQEDGYMLAHVADVDTDEKTHVITFKVIEGVVEAIILQGNETTHDDIILRELQTKPGTVLNEEMLKKDLRQVFNLGFFSEVTPNFQPGTSPNKVVLQLDIKETRSSTVNFGGGYGEREGLFGFTDLSLNNLWGTGQGVMIRGQFGQALSTYQFKYTNPWFMPERFGPRSNFTFRRWLTLGRDVYLNNEDAIYNGFDFSLGRPIFEDTSLTWTIGSELVNPYKTATFEAYQSDTIGATLAYDSRDFWMNPKSGQYYTFFVKQGWKYTSSAAAFFKAGTDLNFYRPVFDNQVIAYHFGIGTGFGDVPIGELYTAGGANTIRGLSAIDARKGRRKVIFNIEYRLDFSDMFQGVLFYDWGNAWDNGAPVPADFVSGWGPGARVNTPMGPIRLDYGVGNGKSFSEGILHFSIGQAF